VNAHPGTAAAYSGPLIFSRLGINAENTFIPHQVALEQMRKGENGGCPSSSRRNRLTLSYADAGEPGYSSSREL